MKKFHNGGTIPYPHLIKILRAMKITALLIVLGLTNVMAVSSYSQKARVSLNMTDARLALVLEEIENQSEFYFLYNQKLIDINRKVSLTAREQKIERILDELFSGTDVNYLVFDRQIVLTTTAAKELNAEVPNGIALDSNGQIQNETRPQQEKVVSGTVKDEENNEGLPQNLDCLAAVLAPL